MKQILNLSIVLMFVLLTTASLPAEALQSQRQSDGAGNSECVTLPPQVPAQAGANERNPRLCRGLSLAYAMALVRISQGITGQAGVRCASLLGTTCNVTGAVHGTGKVTGSQTWNLIVPVPNGVPPNTIGNAVFSTPNGLEAAPDTTDQAPPAGLRGAGRAAAQRAREPHPP